MKKAISYGVLFLLAIALVATLALVASFTAGAQLVGTAFGFPTIMQTGTTTAFNQDTAAATDNEAFALAFPNTGEGIIDGVPETAGFTVGFPTIAQTADQTQVLTHTDFAQTNETAAFAYPFTSVGAAGLPVMGIPGLGIC